MVLSNPATRLTRLVAPRIVGLGASAGGLDALEQFLSEVPPHSGMAIIVVQHLDPTQKALLAELLQRATAMPVREAENGMPIEPDCVYVIPPNTELSVLKGRIIVDSPAAPRGPRLPINVLFSSLARDQGELSVAVVLSGMGADGTLGLQAIKSVGGLTAVQQPDTAQFDAMPKSAIAAGCADIAAPPAELPAHILAYLKHLTALAPETETETETEQEISSSHAAQSSPGMERCKPFSGCCVSAPGMISPITNPARSSAESTGAWRFTRSPPLENTRISSSTTPRRSTCCSRKY